MTTKITWYGHATIGLETSDGYKILIDPFFTGNPAASTTADKVDADFIVVSHGHGDHVGDALDIARRTGALIISNYEITNWLTAQGAEKVHPQHLAPHSHRPRIIHRRRVAHPRVGHHQIKLRPRRERRLQPRQISHVCHHRRHTITPHLCWRTMTARHHLKPRASQTRHQRRADPT